MTLVKTNLIPGELAFHIERNVTPLSTSEVFQEKNLVFKTDWAKQLLQNKD